MGHAQGNLLPQAAPLGVHTSELTLQLSHRSVGLTWREWRAEDKVPTKNVTLQVTGQVAHRNPNTKHKKNEVFLDVVEQVNLLMSHDGAPLLQHLALMRVHFFSKYCQY